jgi:heme A synthase
MKTFLEVVSALLAVVVVAIGTMVVVYAGAIIAIIGSALCIGTLLLFTIKEYIAYRREKSSEESPH